jgi:hypothetical protein
MLNYFRQISVFITTNVIDNSFTKVVFILRILSKHGFSVLVFLKEVIFPKYCSYD